MGRIRLTGATSGYTELRAASTAGNNTITLPTTNGGEVVVSDSSGNVNIDSGTFYVDASNNRVGVGITSPTCPLGFASTTGQKIDLFSSTPGNEFGFGIESNELRICSGTASFIGFRTGGYSGSERARIDSSGRLLVGTTTDPTVGTFASARFSLKQSTDSGIGAGFQVEASGDTSLLWCGYNGTSFDFGTSYRTSGGIKPITFSVGATERMRIDGTGLVTLAGPGIKFPATQVASADANTLDDYEEGTFTASIAGTTSAGTASYSARVGNYTKIGRNVYINIFLDYSSGTGTGNTKITGLPFAPAAAYNVISFSTWALYLSYTGAQVVASTSGGSTEISIQQMNTNGVTALPYESGAAFAVSGFYEV